MRVRRELVLGTEAIRILKRGGANKSVIQTCEKFYKSPSATSRSSCIFLAPLLLLFTFNFVTECTSSGNFRHSDAHRAPHFYDSILSAALGLRDIYAARFPGSLNNPNPPRPHPRAHGVTANPNNGYAISLHQ